MRLLPPRAVDMGAQSNYSLFGACITVMTYFRETKLLLFVQTAMRFSMHHALIALVIAAVFIPENRGAGMHSQWLDALPDFAFNSPIDEDIAILNASMSHSFRFIDLNATDTELLFSVESNR
jgi:hypothetical protein